MQSPVVHLNSRYFFLKYLHQDEPYSKFWTFQHVACLEEMSLSTKILFNWLTFRHVGKKKTTQKNKEQTDANALFRLPYSVKYWGKKPTVHAVFDFKVNTEISPIIFSI